MSSAGTLHSKAKEAPPQRKVWGEKDWESKSSVVITLDKKEAKLREVMGRGGEEWEDWTENKKSDEAKMVE